MTATLTIADVRNAMANAITTGTGLRCAAYRTDSVNPPCALIDRAGMDPRLVFSATKNVYPFKVIVYIGAQSDIASQRTMDTLCDVTGSRSIKLAVENGDLWEVDVDYATVTFIGDTVDRELAGIIYATVELSVEVCW